MYGHLKNLHLSTDIIFMIPKLHYWIAQEIYGELEHSLKHNWFSGSCVPGLGSAEKSQTVRQWKKQTSELNKF